MTDEQLLLATAYVDGELTVSERARVESDPQVWAEVQRQRSVQQLTQAIPPYSQAIAQAQIAAAIASAQPVDSPAGDATWPQHDGKVVHLADRRRRVAWFGGAVAAGLLVAVAATAILANREPLDGTASIEATYAPAGATTSDTMSATDDGLVRADDVEIGEEYTFSDETEPPAAVVQDANPPATDASGEVVGSADVGSSGPLAFDDRGELVEVGRVLLAQAALSVLEPSASTCEVLSDGGDALPILADALYGEDDPQPVVIAVDLSTIVDEQFVVYAADPLSCDVIMSAQGSFKR